MADVFKQSKRDYLEGSTIFGESLNGQDFKVFGDNSGEYIQWDASSGTFTIVGILSITGSIAADDIVFIDDETLQFGTGLDIGMVFDGTSFIISAGTDDLLIEIGDSAVTQKSFDVKWYANEASGTSFLYMNASDNLITTTGVDLQFKDNDVLAFGTGAGGAGDASIVWDATNLIIKATADDTVIEIGDSEGTQLSFDLKWYGNDSSGASFLYFDASENLVYTTGVDMQFKDDDVLSFGTGAGGAGDVSIVWDANNLIIKAAVDDSVIEFGDSGTPQLSFDVKIYGDGAAGASYMVFDAGEQTLKTNLYNVQVTDTDVLSLGTGANALGDAYWTSDGTDVQMKAVAASINYTVGAAANVIDITHFGNYEQKSGYVNLANDTFRIFDDFVYQTLTEADSPWLLHNTGGASDAAISAAERGVLRSTTADADDDVQTICSVPVQADSGGLVFETRLKIDAVTDIKVIVGLVDVSTIEDSVQIAGGDAITTTITDGCVFVFDTAADTDEWFAVGVAGDTDATGNATTTIAPGAGVYQTLRIEISTDGSTALFYIDGTLRATLSANATTNNVNLYASIGIFGNTGATARNLDVDYIEVKHNRI